MKEQPEQWATWREAIQKRRVLLRALRELGCQCDEPYITRRGCAVCGVRFFDA